MPKRRTLKVPNVSCYICWYPHNFSLFVDQTDDETSFLSVFRTISRIHSSIFFLLLLCIYLKLGTDIMYPRGRPCSELKYTSRVALFHDGPVDGNTMYNYIAFPEIFIYTNHRY